MPKSSLDAVFGSVESSTPRLSRRTVDDVVTEALEKMERLAIRMVLMQGPQGVGKTTIAKAIAKRGGVQILSADDYFMKDGSYVFDGTRLADAHAACKRRAEEVLTTSEDVALIDNCNKNMRDASAYMSLVTGHVLVLRIQPKNQVEAIRCGNRSVHQVPSKNVIRTYNDTGELTGTNVITMTETVMGF